MPDQQQSSYEYIQNMSQFELRQLTSARLCELVAFASYPSKLAELIDVSPQVVNGWLNSDRISRRGAELAAQCPAIPAKFTAQYLRPDILTTNARSIHLESLGELKTQVATLTATIDELHRTVAKLKNR